MVRGEAGEGVVVGVFLERLRVMAVEQERRHGNDERAGGTDVAGEVGADQHNGGILQHRAQKMAVFLVADLVRDDREEAFVGGLVRYLA